MDNPPRRKFFPPLIIIIVSIGIFIVYYRSYPKIRLKPPEYTALVGWREEFYSPPENGSLIPNGWRIQRKPGTKAATFSLAGSAESKTFLHLEADRASASLLCQPAGVDVEKMPILRWRWRAEVLPKGADGRMSEKDDQAIGIYVGTGSLLAKKSISYRWDTETPKGAEGNCSYGSGTIRVKWFTLRNKEDARTPQWFTEERNVAEDFKKAWGFYPEKIYIAVSCNSQYTATTASADLDWIELVSLSPHAEKSPSAEKNK